MTSLFFTTPTFYFFIFECDDMLHARYWYGLDLPQDLDRSANGSAYGATTTL